MEWRGGLEPWGPVIRHDLLSAVFFLIFGQISALGINLLDRFATLASSFRFGFVPGWCGPGRVDSEERALLWTVESLFEGCFLFLFLVLVLGSLESLPLPFDGLPSCIFGRWWGEGDFSVRGWGADLDVFVT